MTIDAEQAIGQALADWLHANGLPPVVAGPTIAQAMNSLIRNGAGLDDVDFLPGFLRTLRPPRGHWVPFLLGGVAGGGCFANFAQHVATVKHLAKLEAARAAAKVPQAPVCPHCQDTGVVGHPAQAMDARTVSAALRAGGHLCNCQAGEMWGLMIG